ncbi:MAG TPA: fructose-bisphosphate aldolase [Thermoplasmata archaeon]|nr:fructose-bisphosphate aldolase [Thermoplasmata archaeon]
MPSFQKRAYRGETLGALGLVTRRGRLERADCRIFLLALDHGLPSGPVPGIEKPADFLRSLRGVPFSGVLANPGMVRFIEGEIPSSSGLVVHLSASTVLGARPRSKVLSSTVERAVSLGADAVSVQISFGDSREDTMIADAGRIVDDANSFGVPVVLMAYALAEPGAPSVDRGAAAHAARAAAELGASIVQTNYAADPDGVREIVRGCPAPVVVAGGPRTSEDAFVETLRATLGAGAAGTCVGRQIFQAKDRAAMARRVAQVIFGATEPLVEEAMR